MAPSLNVDMDKTVLGIVTLVLDLPSDLTYKYEKRQHFVTALVISLTMGMQNYIPNQL